MSSQCRDDVGARWPRTRRQRPPNALRRRRHVDRCHAVHAQRVDDGVDQRRRTADRARLARALHAQRIGGAGNFQQIDLDIRQIAGARQRIVHETAGQQLTRIRIEHGVLQDRLTEALRHAAGHLTAHDQRIHRCAKVVTNDIANDGGDAGFRIDLDLRHVAAVGESVIVDRRDLGGVERDRRADPPPLSAAASRRG